MGGEAGIKKIYFREHGGNREAVRLASKNFGVGERSVYKTLRTGKYHLWRDAEKAVDEFVVEIKKVMDNPRTYRIEMEKYSWKSKAREFEDLLEGVVIRGAKIY